MAKTKMGSTHCTLWCQQQS